MKKVMLLLGLCGYISGWGPWCAVNSSGNLSCFYWTYDACFQACNNAPWCVSCTANPN
jgi:hypothetical protein